MTELYGGYRSSFGISTDRTVDEGNCMVNVCMVDGMNDTQGTNKGSTHSVIVLDAWR